MDNSTVSLIQVALTFLILILWITKSKLRKSTGTERTLKSFGLLDFIKALYMVMFEEPEIISGYKVSQFQKPYKKYVSAFSKYCLKESSLVKIFGKPVVFIATGCEIVSETTTNEAFCDRAPESSLRLYHGGKPTGMLMNNYKDGKTVKTFVMKKLGVLGLRNKETMDSILAEQLSELLDYVEKLKDEKNKIQVQGLFSAAIFNVISNFASGTKVSATDPEFINAHKTFADIANFPLHNLVLLHFFSKLRGLRDLFGYSRLGDLRKGTRKILKKLIDERKAITMQMDNRDPENLIDYFLQEIKKEEESGASDPIFTTEQLVTVLQDMTVAGVDTVSKYLEFFLMFMCLYPDVQDKVQKEIDAAFGITATPCYFDCKGRMNYTMATLWEVNRLAHLVPFMPRMTTKDVGIAGHHLKKGTVIVQAYFKLRLDETYWKKPFDFYPEHFLDADGMLIQDKINRMMIFGKGVRGCPGEQIATATLFTFGVGILQKYNIRKGENSDILGSMIKPCPVNGLEPFQVKLVDR